MQSCQTFTKVVAKQWTGTKGRKEEKGRKGEERIRCASVACCEAVRGSPARCLLAWCDAIWHGVAWRGVAWHARARARPTPCDSVAPLPREDRLFGPVRVYDPAGPQNLRCPLKNDPNT